MSTSQRQPGAASGPEPLLLVTGAAGSVGAQVVEEALAGGWRVRGTDRVPSPFPPRPGLEWQVADLAQARGASGLVEGVRAVVHTAAWVDIHASYERQAVINYEAVCLLYEAAAAAGVRDFVHLSTASLYAPSPRPLAEDAPLMPTSGYERAKLLAEDFLAARRGAGPRVRILRPALIYGPRGRVLLSPVATLPPLLGAFDGALPHLRGGPRTNLVHARDVARAALFVLASPGEDGEVFNVAAPEAADLGHYLDVVCELGGLRLSQRSLGFPVGLLRLLEPLLARPAGFALLNGGLRALWARTRRKHDLASGGLVPRVDPEALPYLSGQVVFDGARLRWLGFRFLFPDFRSGWADSLAWYRRQRWLPGA